MTIQQVAELCHEANKTYCEQLGDNSQVSWKDAPTNIQQSAIAGIEYKLKNPNATPKQQHQAWLDFKVKDGWVFGDVKNSVLKTHPSLIPYEQLSEAEKVKDHLFTGIVRSLTQFIV